MKPSKFLLPSLAEIARMLILNIDLQCRFMVNIRVSLMKIGKTFTGNPVIYDSRLYCHSPFINSTTSLALSEFVRALQKDFELANFAISARAST
jgi:hypothetical protein